MAHHQNLLNSVKSFLSLHWDQKSPLLLACSGGPDSKALLHLFINDKYFIELKVHVAHIDHGWRSESASQAQMLQEEVNALGLPFHLCRLKDIPQKENAAREARYAFLGEIAKEVGAQAVLLGHQMEDQAETVLKRVLEGASLPSCRGMQPVSERDGMVLWRPLLSVSKKELVAWLDGKGISYVQDETNLSPEYLRGRFRTEIFPFLEKAFGKSVMKNLSRLGERAGKLERFLDQLVGPLGDESSILLTRLQGLDEVALDYFLKKWTRSKKINLSLDQLTLLERMVSTGDSQIQVQTATHRFEVVQGKLALKKLYDYLDNKEAVKK